MAVVLGVDLSLTMTGLAHLDTDPLEWVTHRVKASSPVAGDVRAQSRRLRRIARAVLEFAGRVEPAGTLDAIVIEGMSFGSVGAGSRDIGGAWWRTVDELALQYVCPIIVVAPASRAKYAAGSGRASKADVLACVRETYPAADVPQHDVADAVALAAIGARVLGFPVEQVARPWVEDVAAQIARREREKEARRG